MQMKIQVHKSLLVSFWFYFTQEQYEQLMRQLHKCISVQMTVGRIHSLHMGWRNFFSSCAVVSVFQLWQETVLGVTDLPYQLCCYVFFWLRREIVLGCTGQFLVVAGNSFRCYLLNYHTSWRLFQFFGCSGKQLLVAQFIRKILILFL